MTRTFNKIVIASTALFALSLGATGASAAPASESATAKAKVVRPLTMTKNSDLDFGTILLVNNVASSVTVGANGALTPCPAAVTCSGATTAASFKVTGVNNSTVTVTMPTSVQLKNTDGVTMTATLANVPSLALGNSGNSGTTLAFGGTLAVGANQAEGIYASDAFNVTVNY